MQPGRGCPLHYRYAPSALAKSPEFAADTLYVIGGLYGNPIALEALLDLAAREAGPVRLVFNGDFHWFDIDDAAYSVIGAEVLRHTALRGNVETELADEEEAAGCGCTYPEWVADEEVECSNCIIKQLRVTARRFPIARTALSALPMYLTARVGDIRVGIVHGDAHSLSGWSYAQEHCNGAAGLSHLVRDFMEADCRVLASTHTCLPIAVDGRSAQGRCVLINNGAAGMPNFRDTRYGVITRIALGPASHVAPLYATRLGSIHIEALALHYDHARWRRMFLANWPAGSPAHRSYFARIERGPRYALSQAVRWRTIADEKPAGGAAREEIAT